MKLNLLTLITLLYSFNGYCNGDVTATNTGSTSVGVNIIAGINAQLTNGTDCIQVNNNTTKAIFFPYRTASEVANNPSRSPVPIGPCGPDPVGFCGLENGGLTAPTGTISPTGSCAVGTYNYLAGDGSTWSWECIAAGGTAPCSSTSILNTNGACSVAVNGCSSTGGMTNTADSATHYQWTCNGTGTGSNTPCSSPIPRCGPANGNSYGDAAAVSAAGLCDAGTGSVSGAAPWNWSCATGVSGSTPALCSATGSLTWQEDGTASGCLPDSFLSTQDAFDPYPGPDPEGTACTLNGAYSFYDDRTNPATPCMLCIAGTTCNRAYVCGGGTVNINENGACGIANGQPSPILTTKACSAGTLDNLVRNNTTGDTWNCNGYGTGTNASCSGTAGASYTWVETSTGCNGNPGPVLTFPPGGASPQGDSCPTQNVVSWWDSDNAGCWKEFTCGGTAGYAWSNFGSETCSIGGGGTCDQYQVVQCRTTGGTPANRSNCTGPAPVPGGWNLYIPGGFGTGFSAGCWADGTCNFYQNPTYPQACGVTGACIN